MKKSIAIALFALLALGAAGTLEAAIVGDIDNDGTISLAEAIYALQVTAGNVTNVPDSCAITGRGLWDDLDLGSITINLCDVVQYNSEYYICSPPSTIPPTLTCGVATPPNDNSDWQLISLTGLNGLNSAIAISESDESIAAECENGGIMVQARLDNNRNGTFDIGIDTVTATDYVCNGNPGDTGPTGLACWDLDKDSVCDAEEDIDGITGCDVGDCRGPQGEVGGAGLACWDLNEDSVCNAEEDIDGITGCDSRDCQGEQGGLGETGLSCWDLDEDRICDNEEDINGDSNCNAFDCQSQGGDQSSEPETRLSNSIGMTFRIIPAGTFTMGSPVTETGREWGPNKGLETQHDVTITESYYMQTTEVTQGQWMDVRCPVARDCNPVENSTCDNCAVGSVSWNMISNDFLPALNALGEGTYRLPTEAEWERAARAGTITATYNGDITVTVGRDPALDPIAWYYASGAYNISAPAKVAQRQPNGWGLYDMLGNVYEWVEDWFQNDLGTTTVPIEENPLVDQALEGNYKVLKGGKYSYGYGQSRAAHRGKLAPESSDPTKTGFRLVMSP